MDDVKTFSLENFQHLVIIICSYKENGFIRNKTKQYINNTNKSDIKSKRTIKSIIVNIAFKNSEKEKYKPLKNILKFHIQNLFNLFTLQKIPEWAHVLARKL